MQISIGRILKREFYFNDSTQGIDRLDIELLLSKALGKERSFILSHPEFMLEGRPLLEFNSFLKRRKTLEPLAYITGYKEFYGHEFKVNKATLIPRPETERLVDLAIDKLQSPNLKSQKEIRLLEIGTGTGCIPISILLEAEARNLQQSIEITAIDISEAALETAQENLNTYQSRITKHKLNFKKLDILDTKALDDLNVAGFDIIISNPPYIPTEELDTLDPGVKDFEPRGALDGGSDGMKFYERILELVKDAKSKPTLIFEIHSPLASKYDSLVKKYLPNAKFEILKDDFGRERFGVVTIY